MRRTRLFDRVVLGLACAASVAPAQDSRPAAPPAVVGWWDDLFADRATTLAEVVQKPDAYRGRTLRFAIQFRRTAKLADAYHTPYVDAQWLNVVSWPEEAPLWDERAFRDDHAYGFIRRDHPEAAALKDAPPYARFSVRARVVEVLKGVPWIEFLHATPLPGRLTEAALLRITKAHRLAAFRKFESAADEFAAADDPMLPVSLRVRLKNEAAACLDRSQRPRAAAAALREALELAPDDAPIAAALSALRARLKGGASEERPASDLIRAPASRPAGP